MGNIIPSSCEIEDFVESHFWKMCVVTPIAHSTACVLVKDVCRLLPLELHRLNLDQQSDMN